MSIETIFSVEFVALCIGYAVLVAGGIGSAAVLFMWPLEIAWRKWGDAKALMGVCIEARKQGRSIWGQRERDDD